MQPVQLQDHSLEVNLISQYEQNLTKLTEFYRQRAKKHWATQGDRNTSYFHNVVHKRRRRNRIICIKDNLGRSNLSSTQPRDTQDFTNSIPDKKEVWEILKSMKKNASPGPDGFSVGFYISAWSWKERMSLIW